MKNPSKRRYVSAQRVKALFSEIGSGLCAETDCVLVGMRGNTFYSHVDGGTVNITISETPSKKGGAQ